MRLNEANLLTWADSVDRTGWEVLLVLPDWLLALVTVLVEVDRSKMVVV